MQGAHHALQVIWQAMEGRLIRLISPSMEGLINLMGVLGFELWSSLLHYRVLSITLRPLYYTVQTSQIALKHSWHSVLLQVFQCFKKPETVPRANDSLIIIMCLSFSVLQKWLGLEDVPREFVQQVYWTFKKLPETKWIITQNQNRLFSRM